jgi:hypothetical protein
MQLSSSQTTGWKFHFPTYWTAGFGAAIVGIWLGAFRGPNHELAPAAMRWQLLGVWLISSTLLIRFGWRLHRVSLHDSTLTVSNYFREISIPMANVSRVTQSYMSKPPTITIHLKQPTALGRRILFIPAEQRPDLPEHPTTRVLKEILARTNKDDHPNT